MTILRRCLPFHLALAFVFVPGLIGCGDDKSGDTDATTDMASDVADDTVVVDMTPDLPTDLADATDADPGDMTDVPEDMAQPETLLETYLLDDDEAFPEGVTFDPVDRAFYTGSMARGNVTRIAANGSQSEFFAGNSLNPDSWLILGLEVDPTRRRLWVCAAFGRELSQSEVWVLDLATGDRLWNANLQNVFVGAACTDMIIEPTTGIAYVCDREAGNIYRLDMESQAIDPFASDPLLDPGTIGQNGIAFTPDGQYLLTAKLLPVQLMRISLADPTDIVEVDLVTAPGETIEGGTDALVVLDGNAYMALERHVIRAVPNADWTSAQVSIHPLTTADGGELTGVSGLTAAEGALYVSKSDVFHFALNLSPDLPFLLRRVELSVFD